MIMARGTFQVTGWDEEPYQELEGGRKLTRARIAQDFHGDVEASGTWEVLMCYGEDGGAEFLGLAQLSGRIGGRSGSVTMKSDGTFDGQEARIRWQVIAGSGTGGLAGLRGEGTSVAPHGTTGTFTLDYDFA